MLGTSTRTSDVLINLGLNPLRRLREVGSPQFGVLSARAPPSPRCTALTAASCENHGAAPNYGTRVPGIFGGNDRFAGKVGFSPDLESTRMWAASLEKAKRKTTHHRHLRYPKLLAAGAGLSSCSPPHVPL